MEISDFVYIDSTGYHYGDYPTFQTWIRGKYTAIYGPDVYLGSDSQDGQFMDVIAKAFFDLAAIGSVNNNSLSPASAQGVGLARIVKINGMTKQAATSSTVDLLITGDVGTTITNGIARDTLNQLWALPASVTIPPAGNITVTATAKDMGAIRADANTVTNIYTPTLGWLTVNNPTAATAGQAVESDATLRGRQQISTALPSLSVFEGTEGAVENVAGVTDSRGYENDTDTTDANGIPEHSISMVVAGGDDTDIATAIRIHKGPGCGTYGTTSIDLVDSKGVPITIKFYRPTQVTIGVKIDMTALPGFTTGFEATIKQAVADYINAIRIGDDVLYSKIFIPANLPGNPAGATYNITQIQIKKNAGAFGTSDISIAFNEKTFCDPAINVTLVVT